MTRKWLGMTLGLVVLGTAGTLLYTERDDVLGHLFWWVLTILVIFGIGLVWHALPNTLHAKLRAYIDAYLQSRRSGVGRIIQKALTPFLQHVRLSLDTPSVESQTTRFPLFAGDVQRIERPQHKTSTPATTGSDQAYDSLAHYFAQRAQRVRVSVEKGPAAVAGAPELGTRAIARHLVAELRQDGQRVFYFDATALPPHHRYEHFRWNLCAELAIDLPANEALPATWEIRDALEQPTCLWSIIIAADELLAATANTRRDELAEILESLHAPMGRVVITTENFGSRELANRFKEERRHHVTRDANYSNQVQLALAAVGIDDQQLASRLSFDHVRVAIPYLASAPDNSERQRRRTDLTSADPLKIGTQLLRYVIHNIAEHLTTPTDNEGTIRAACLCAITAAARADWMLRFDELEEMLRVASTPYASANGDDTFASRFAKALTDAGIIEVQAAQDDTPDELAVYQLRRAYRNIARPNNSIDDAWGEAATAEGISAEELRKAVMGGNHVAQTLEAAFEPRMPTPLSSFLSRDIYHWAGDLMGLVREINHSSVCVIPLPHYISRNTTLYSQDTEAYGRRPIRNLALRIYDWTDASAATEAWKQTHNRDLMITLAGYQQLTDFWVVRVHLVSKPGTGGDVLDVIRRHAGTVAYVEGDAYRSGPGGVVEVVVLPRAEGAQDAKSVALAIETELRRNTRDRNAEVRIEPIDISDVMSDMRSAIIDVADQGILFAEDAAEYIPAYAGIPAIIIRGPAFELLERYVNDATSQGTSGRFDPAGGHIQFKSYTSGLLREVVIVTEQRMRSSEASGLQPATVQLACYLYPSGLRSIDDTANRRLATGARIAIDVLKIAAETSLNLLALRPLGEHGCRAVFEIRSTRVRDAVSRVQSLLRERGIEMAPLGSPISDIQPNYEVTWAGLDPAAYHREMRHHLFLGDADAVATAFVAGEYGRIAANGGVARGLEIGAGTGALTEKLLLRGCYRLDTVETSERLRAHWVENVLPALPRSITARLPQRHDYLSTLEELRNAPAFVDANGANAREPYDVLVSQGVHHHCVPEGDDKNNIAAIDQHRCAFMNKCAELVKLGGAYVISDEFLAEYEETSEAERIKNLDRWYECVIAHALAQGRSELAQMETFFWHSDRGGRGEYKESIEVFTARLARVPGTPFRLETVVRLGFSEGCPGGFAVLLLRRQ